MDVFGGFELLETKLNLFQMQLLNLKFTVSF